MNEQEDGSCLSLILQSTHRPLPLSVAGRGSGSFDDTRQLCYLVNPLLLSELIHCLSPLHPFFHLQPLCHSQW